MKLKRCSFPGIESRNPGGIVILVTYATRLDGGTRRRSVAVTYEVLLNTASLTMSS